MKLTREELVRKKEASPPELSHRWIKATATNTTGRCARCWRHGRAINVSNLRGIGVKITDYSEDAELDDVTTHHYTLMRMSFEQSVTYRIFETKD